MLEKAIKIATEVHAGQTDKSGQPYILHCLRVMNAGITIDEKIVGVLHDVVEDTNITLESLKEQGFNSKIISALDCITKRKNENYNDFIGRVLKNSLATKVKLNDLQDNLDIKRLIKVNVDDLQRLNKYLSAYQKISNVINT